MVPYKVCVSDTVRPRATETIAPLGRHLITLQLITMGQMIEKGSTIHSLSAPLSAMEMGHKTALRLMPVQ